MLGVLVSDGHSSSSVNQDHSGHLSEGLELLRTHFLKDAWGWCTGMTQRDGMGRQEGGGFGMGSTCIPVADSF